MTELSCGIENTVVIFGYSNIGWDIYRVIRADYNGEILFCDNSSMKLGCKDGVKIISVEQAVEEYRLATFILASRYHTRQMKDQLLHMGIKEDHIKDIIPSYFIKREDERISTLSQTKMKRLQFEISITKKCNLNCKSCDHFAPLANDDEFLDISTYKKDMDRMFELFGDSICKISILGGEPLLNPQINEYIDYARKRFSQAIIRIITNGILINKMDDEFWKACRKNSIMISVTKYPIRIKYEEIKSKTLKEGCDFEYVGVSEATRTFWHEPLDLNGKQNGTENFRKCTFGNACIVLDHGKLYSCIIPANIDLFNKYFDKKLEVTSDDYIDIYAENNREDILLKLTQPLQFCKYCDIDHRTYDHPFEVSLRRISEWTLTSEGEK